MCNHYRTIPERIPDWAEWAGYRLLGPVTEGDIWPKRLAPIARVVDGERVIDSVRWGVPFETAGKSGKPVTKWITNVRNLSSGFWRNMLAKPAHRCLVPFSQFAEPVIGGGRAEHWFSLPGSEFGAFAGIWRPSEVGDVFAFLTTAPNPLVAPLHPKAMPVILHPDSYAEWMQGDYQAACALAQPFPSQLMAVA